MIVAKRCSSGSLMLRRSSVAGSFSSSTASDLSSAFASTLRRSSSSLYLQGLASESCTNPPSPSFARNESFSESEHQQYSLDTVEGAGLANYTLPPQYAPFDDEGKCMVVQTLLILMALQVIPSYLMEFVQRVDISGLPILIAFGMVPSVFLKLNQGRTKHHCESCVSSSASSSTSSSLECDSSHDKEPLSSLAEIESYYGQLTSRDHLYAHSGDGDDRGWAADDDDNWGNPEGGVMSPTHLGPFMISSSNLQGPDDSDWGQFAYYDEKVDEPDLAARMMRSCSLSSSSRLISLQTWLETEEEDGCDDSNEGGSCTFLNAATLPA